MRVIATALVMGAAMLLPSQTAAVRQHRRGHSHHLRKMAHKRHRRGCHSASCDKRIDRAWAIKHRPKIRFGSWRSDGASWYGPADSGGNLACGGGALTSSTVGVANKYLPCGTPLEICYSSCMDVTVVDRGPYIAGREFDLTEATARQTGFISAGVGTIRWRLIYR